MAVKSKRAILSGMVMPQGMFGMASLTSGDSKVSIGCVCVCVWGGGGGS